jgi:probable HAF family extracellular repeat protein
MVTGYSNTTSGAYHATVWIGSVITDLGTLGGAESYGRAINDAGDVVGLSDVTGNHYYHGFFWNGSMISDLGTLGGSSSGALAINDLGEVAGWSTTSGNSAHATL